MEIRGIDRDGESRSLVVEVLPVRVIAEDLYWAGWKYAAIYSAAGEVVGGVRLDPHWRTRVWWWLHDAVTEVRRCA